MGGISVIIVSWNTRDHLRNCLVSVRETGGATIKEVIVVDNASTDGSPEMVAEEFPEVLLVRTQENLGFARANNLGLKRASGSWLALINSDVIVHRGSLQHMTRFLENHVDVGLVGPKVLGADSKLQRTCKRLPTLWNTVCKSLALHRLLSKSPLFSSCEMDDWNQDETAEVEVLAGCFWVARRQAVKEVGGLDERFFFYAEDVDWCKRFWDKGWKVVFISEATTTHFGGTSSARAPFRYGIEQLRASLTYWRKHRGIAGQAACYLLCIVHHTFRLIARGMNVAVADSNRAAATYMLKHHLYCLRWLLIGKHTKN